MEGRSSRRRGRVGPGDDKVDDEKDNDNGAHHEAHALAQLLLRHHVQLLHGRSKTRPKFAERIGLV